MVKRIIVHTLTTASLTAMLAACEAFLLMVFWQQTSAYAAIGLVVPGISTMSVLTTLRTRESLAAAIEPGPTQTEVFRAFGPCLDVGQSHGGSPGDAEAVVMLVGLDWYLETSSVHS